MTTYRQGGGSPLVPFLFILLLVLVACFAFSFMGPGGAFGWAYGMRDTAMLTGMLLGTIVGLGWALRRAFVPTFIGMMSAMGFLFFAQLMLRTDVMSNLTNDGYEPSVRIFILIGIVLVAGLIFSSVFRKNSHH